MCVCLYINIHMYVCIHTCMYACTRTHTYMYMCVYLSIVPYKAVSFDNISQGLGRTSLAECRMDTG